MSKVFIGIDASLSRTGLSFTDGLGHFVKSMTVSAPKDMRGMPRLDNLLAQLTKIMDECPNLAGAAIEGYAFGVRGGRLADLAEWGGLIRILLYRLRIPTIVVPPMTLKKFLHDGKLEKNQVLLQVYKQYGHSFDTDDEADAFVLSEMARSWVLSSDDLPTRKKEALQKSSVLVSKKPVRERERNTKSLNPGSN